MNLLGGIGLMLGLKLGTSGAPRWVILAIGASAILCALWYIVVLYKRNFMEAPRPSLAEKAQRIMFLTTGTGFAL